MLPFSFRDSVSRLVASRKRRTSKRNFSHKLLLESLEPRQLLASDPGAWLDRGLVTAEVQTPLLNTYDHIAFHRASNQGEGEGEPQLSINDVIVTEGQTAVFTISLSPASGEAVWIDCDTSDGTAYGGYEPGSGYDYQSAYSSLYFAAGQTTQTLSVATFADMETEGDETFTVQLSTSWGAYATGTGTIQNDSSSVPQLSITDATVTEGHAAVFTVTLSPARTQALTVDYYTSDGTAYGGYEPGSGYDYQSAYSSLYFAAG